jgi:Mn-dependent DtxR family transcriptional regulator
VKRIEEILRLISHSNSDSDSGEGLLAEEIAADLKISDANSRTTLYKMRRQGLVKRCGGGGAKTWGITRKGEKLLAIYDRKELARKKLKK